MLMSVRCLVCMYDFRRLARWWATAFLAILKPLRVLLLYRRKASADMYLYRCYGYAVGVNGCMWQK